MATETDHTALYVGLGLGLVAVAGAAVLLTSRGRKVAKGALSAGKAAVRMAREERELLAMSLETHREGRVAAKARISGRDKVKRAHKIVRRRMAVAAELYDLNAELAALDVSIR